MLKSEITNEVLDILENRVSSLSTCIVLLNKEGYLPNKVKLLKLQCYNMLIAAYQQIDSMNEEQENKLNILFNKIEML